MIRSLEGTGLYYFIQFMYNLSLGAISPTCVLYLRHFQIDLFQVVILFASFELFIVLFEIPTGIFADTFGRKPAILLAFSIMSIAGIVYGASSFLIFFFIAEMLQALGESFSSGALEAWVVDTLEYDKQEERMDKVFAKGVSIGNLGILLGASASGFIFFYAPRLIWFFFGLNSLVVAAVVAVFLTEKRMIEHVETKSEFLSDMKEKLYKSISIIGKRRILFLLVFAVILSSFAFEGVDTYWQVLFNEELNVDVKYVGWIYSIGYFVSMITVTYVINRLRKLKNEVAALALIQALTTTFVLILALTTWAPLSVVAFIIVLITRDYKEPIFLTVTNKHIPSDRRATVLSFFNMMGSLGETLSAIPLGTVALLYGVRAPFVFSVVLLTLVTLVFARTIRYQPRKH